MPPTPQTSTPRLCCDLTLLLPGSASAAVVVAAVVLLLLLLLLVLVGGWWWELVEGGCGGDVGRHQEAPGCCMSPGSFRELQEASGDPRKPQDAPECFRELERAKSVIGVAKIDPREPNL